jgi:DNA-binding NtrC family response regulator
MNGQEDVPDLVRYFIRRYAGEFGSVEPTIQPEAIEHLQRQPWPGNVRELENVVRQALLIARPMPVTLTAVQQALARTQRPLALEQRSHADYVRDLLDRARRGEVEGAYRKLIEDLEPELFSQAIKLAGGNQAKAARWLGVTRLKMREKLAQFGLQHSAFPQDS